ncbi:MAG TPA: hypothetical protein DCM86_05840 [Verrucomicrobiales bacterium]|nr:hypothetical protein [Verrucomicrobiales bacterium]
MVGDLPHGMAGACIGSTLGSEADMRAAKPLRILWVSDSPLMATGFARVTREVVGRLLFQPGLEVTCLGWGYDGWPYDPARFAGRIYPCVASRHGGEVFERVVNEFRPQVVITLGEIWMLQWLQSHPARGEFKWIAYLPIDGGPVYPPWEPILRGMDEIVAMSAFGQEILRAGVPSKRIHLIPHGVDPGVFRPLANRIELKSEPRIRGKFVIGCVARNQPRKNIPALVKAFSRVVEKHQQLHLILHMNPCDVGHDLVTLLKRYGLEGCADVGSPHFSHQEGVSDEELNVLYNVCDLTVLPTNAEGFGLPIIESLAAGTPVVATDHSACPELVRGRGELARVAAMLTVGTNLIEHAIVDVDDLAACIERLYLDPERLRSHGRAGRAFAETLAWDNLLPQWLRVIGMVSGGGPADSH